ncbi:MAG TPA: transporter substrate-binding domain-containing protein [Candidatus Limnocylindria bacterium]|nr:transporter substrate-binding domain-containing protein [Candidatus Limnocylindria bacterium]
MIAQSVKDQLAPSGKLRIGINYGNAVLAKRDGASGELRGVAVDLARELGRRCQLAVELVAFESAGKMAAAVKAGAWDAAFLAVEPGRADELAFTAPYLLIEGTYLTPPGSPIRSIADVDRAGVRIGVSTGSAYELFLSRNLRQAQTIKAENPNTTFDLLIDGKVDVVAGVRQALLANAAKLPGSRVFDERFMAIEQAMGMPHGREAGLQILREFIEEMKASGFVAQALERAGIRGVAVAPADAPEQGI